MAGFIKTLFGDIRTMAIVAGVLAIEAGLVHTGHGTTAAILVPVATLAGVAYLART